MKKVDVPVSVSMHQVYYQVDDKVDRQVNLQVYWQIDDPVIKQIFRHVYWQAQEELK